MPDRIYLSTWDAERADKPRDEAMIAWPAAAALGEPHTEPYLRASTVNARIAELERDRDEWKVIADALFSVTYCHADIGQGSCSKVDECPACRIMGAYHAATPSPPNEGSGT